MVALYPESTSNIRGVAVYSNTSSWLDSGPKTRSNWKLCTASSTDISRLCSCSLTHVVLLAIANSLLLKGRTLTTTRTFSLDPLLDEFILWRIYWYVPFDLLTASLDPPTSKQFLQMDTQGSDASCTWTLRECFQKNWQHTVYVEAIISVHL